MNLKRILAGVLACCVVGGALPSVGGLADNAVITVSAADDTKVDYLDRGDHIEVSYCGKSATSVVIPAEIGGLPVTRIGLYAFMDCSELKEITIPDSVTSIGGGAFIRCFGLTEINIPDSVTDIENGAFGACIGLTEITIPDSVTRIGDSAFQVCRGLTEITILNPNCEIADNGDTISNGHDKDTDTYYFNGTIYGYENSTAHEYAAKYGYKFVALDSEGSTTEPTENTYESLTYVNYGDYIEITGCDSSVTEVVIPAEIDNVPVTSIGNGVFFECSELKEITIPDSVTNIGGEAFYNTPWLESKREKNPLVIVNGILIDGTTCSGDVVIPNNVTSISNSAFSNCMGLTKITIPDSVTTIDNFAFYNCPKLTEITIPNSIISIGNWAFSGCMELTEINIPNSVTSIGSSTFEFCTGLTKITISDSVTSIGGYIFFGCSGLTEINIPESVTSIGDAAFSGCTELTKISIFNSNCEISDNESAISDTATIYGYENSTAQAYAEKYNRKFVSLDAAPEKTAETGDIDGDGKIDSSDASLVLVEYSLLSTGKNSSLSESQKKRADLNKDGTIDASDASLILAYYSYAATNGTDTIDVFLEKQGY